MIYFCLLFFFGFCFSVHNELVYLVGQLTVQLILLCEDDERKYNKNRRDNKHHCGNGVLCELCLNGESRIIVGELKSEGYDYRLYGICELLKESFHRENDGLRAIAEAVFAVINDIGKHNGLRNEDASDARFSFNVKGGRCEACQGDGIVKIEMHFLADIYVPCDVCKGARYNRETLEVKYKGKNIYDVLEMTVEEGLEFFSSIPKIKRKLQTLYDVGLGYVKIGQPATTLSGGEAQRVKLSTELSRRSTGKTVYILDEPTTGLHTADVHKLIEVLHRLVDNGNSVIVIEHNLDVIKTADWILDLGPEGGDEGGEIIAQGTPEQVAATEGSYTGQYLKKLLNDTEE